MDLVKFSLLRLRPALVRLQRTCYPCVGVVGIDRTTSSLLHASKIHTSVVKGGLYEFFDNKDNYDREKVEVGRPWRLDELRIKSNEDLHKLWYVFLKERNMVLTMEDYYKGENESELFPSPERLEKIEESMENLIEVIRERDIAYNLLRRVKQERGRRK